MLIPPPPFCGGALCDNIKEKLLHRRLGQAQSINQSINQSNNQQKWISRLSIGKHLLQTNRIQYGVFTKVTKFREKFVA